MGTDAAVIDACDLNMVDPGKVTAVRESLPAPEDVGELADVFSLLGDPGRLRLLMSLLAGGEMCVCDLAATALMSESSVSHALRLLRAHRVVSVSRRGRMAYYRLDDAHVRMLLELGLTHIGHTVAIHPEPTTTNSHGTDAIGTDGTGTDAIGADRIGAARTTR